MIIKQASHSHGHFLLADKQLQRLLNYSSFLTTTEMINVTVCVYAH